MSPNFWGCRCCGRTGPIIFRMLDSDGNQLWTWDEQDRIRWHTSNREDGFCLNADGYVGYVRPYYEPGGFEAPVMSAAGLIDPDGTTIWHTDMEDEDADLSWPVLDSDLNLYAVSRGEGLLYSWDADGVFRWSVATTVNSSLDGPRCRGNVIYLKGVDHTIVSFDQSGTLLGTNAYGSSGAASIMMGVDASGNGIVMRSSPDQIDILDDDCTVLSSLPFTLSDSSPASTGVIGPMYAVGRLSTGNLACVGNQIESIFSNRSVVYDLTADSQLFYPLPAYDGTPSIRPMNSAIDGDGGMYVVRRESESGSNDGYTVYKYSEGGSLIYTIRETPVETGFSLPSSAVENGVQIAAVPGRLLIASAYPRAKAGWTIS